MTTSATKEVLTIGAALAAGILVISAYQNSESLFRFIEGAAGDSNRTSQELSQAAKPIQRLRESRAASEPDALPVTSAPNSPASANEVSVQAQSVGPTLAITSASEALRPASGANGYIARTVHVDRLRALREESNSFLEKKSATGWTNEGLSLWRSCVAQFKAASRASTNIDLLEICNRLLADGVRSSQARLTENNAQEILALTREFRSERALLSPAQASEVDRLMAAARTLIAQRDKLPSNPKPRSGGV